MKLIMLLTIFDDYTNLHDNDKLLSFISVLTNQIFLAYLSTTAVAWFTLLGAFVVGLVKIILDWVPHDQIKAARSEYSAILVPYLKCFNHRH